MVSRSFYFILLSFLVAGCAQTQQFIQTINVNTSVTGGSSSNISILPNSNLTPGALNPDVTQDNIQQTICVSGYTDTIRPPTSYTNKLKALQIQQYGYADTNLSDFELDHLISLEIGGCPTCPENLWPEPYYGNINARTKDQIENKLHSLVCSGQMNLSTAQNLIATDWYAAYLTYVK